MVSCNKENDDIVIDPYFIDGQWEITGGNDPDVVRGCILDIQTDQSLSYGASGTIYTFFLTANGVRKDDKIFNWNIPSVDNHYPVIELLQEELNETDNNSIIKYRITKLTKEIMWWERYDTKNDNTIMMRRYAPGK